MHYSPTAGVDPESKGRGIHGTAVIAVCVSYRIARKFGVKLKLAVWESFSEQPNLIQLKCRVGQYCLSISCDYCQYCQPYHYHCIVPQDSLYMCLNPKFPILVPSLLPLSTNKSIILLASNSHVFVSSVATNLLGTMRLDDIAKWPTIASS